jgi:hypothetical protein
MEGVPEVNNRSQCVSMRMSKKPLNLLIEADLVQKARDNGLVISKFLEIKLQEYFSFIDAVSKPNTLGMDAGNGIRTRVSSLGS